MIDTFRRLAASGVSKVLLGVLILSFAVWGISDIFRGLTPDTVARVGKTEVPLTEFQRIYSIQVNNVRQQLGTALTPEMIGLLQIDRDVLGRLVSEAALDDEAARFGLGLSDETLAAHIRNDPNWNPNGRGFDGAYMDRVLASNGLSRVAYEEQRRQQELRAQLAEGVVGGLESPDALRRAAFEHRTEQRSIRYLVLDEAHAGAVPAPTDEQLRVFYQDNRARYRAPEYRAANLLSLSPEGLAKPEDITDEAIAAAYEARLATVYTTPGQSHVWQIVFPTREEAGAARASLAADTTFDQLVTSTGLKPTDLGVVARTQISDPAVANAAFALGEGEVSPVIEGRFGFVLVRATEVQPDIVRTLDEVRGELRDDLARREAVTQILALHEQVEDTVAGGETLEEVAGRLDLAYRTIPAIDEDGLAPDGTPVPDLPGAGQLIGELFQTDVGLANAPLEYASNAFVWYEVTAITPPRDLTFDEVKDKVAEAWRDDAVDTRLAEAAEAIAAKLRAGGTLEESAAGPGVEVLTAEGLTRSSTPTETLSTTAIDAAFGGPDGLVAVAAGVGPATQIILKVTGVSTPPYLLGTADTTAEAQRLDEAVSNDILNQYVGALQTELGVSVNEQAVRLAVSTAR